MERSTRFELISKLGEGGMGVVYEALDRERNMRVALKTLRRMDAASLYRFKREFRAVSDLSHPNIVALYELGSEEDDYFLAMELVEGSDFIAYVRGNSAAGAMPHTPSELDNVPEQTLDTRVVHPVSSSDKSSLPPLTVAPGELVDLCEIVDVERLHDGFAQLAQALYALHSQGIVHRDLKPSNVRATPQGRVVLMDFGIVAETEENQGETLTGLGTPMYMAPEQAEGAAPTAAADWYAFGVLLYQALAGRLPFRGPSDKVLLLKKENDPPPPSTFTNNIPAHLEAICMELLSRNPDDRPQGYDVLTRLGVGAESISRLMSEVTFVGPSDFVGRSRHLEELGEAYRAALEGKAVCVLAEGSSGMGKTTLLRRFVYEIGATQADGELPLILSGRCHERESLSYKAFDGVIDRLSRELLEQPAELVEALLPDDIDLLTRLFPVLRRIPGVQIARPMGGRNPLELRSRAIAALRVLLDRIGAWRPVVIRIEDLQWADSDSSSLLVELLRSPAPRRLLILASLRSDGALSREVGDGESMHELGEALLALAEEVPCHRIEVGPLSNTEQQLLVAKLCGESNLPTDLDDEFWNEAEGNPLLLTELARFAAEAPELIRSSRRLQIDDVIARRIERLPDSARALLEIISVSGEPTPLVVLGNAVGLSDDDRERASNTLRVAKLARIALPGHEPWLNVQHDKIRETVLARLARQGDTHQKKLHLRLARALEMWDSASVSSLARHWLAAGDREQAAKFLIAAARGAVEKLAFDRAAELYQAALDISTASSLRERLALYEPLGDALTLAGRHFEAARVYQQAAALAGADRAIDYNRRAADNLLRSGRIREGLGKLDEVMKEIGRPLPRGRGSTLSRLVRRATVSPRSLDYTVRTESEVAPRDLGHIDTLYAAASVLAMMDPVQSSLIQAQHIKAALRAGEERRVCRALAMETSLLGARGGKHSRQAEELGRDALWRARKLGDPYTVGITQLGSAMTAFYSARMRAAAQAFDECLETLRMVVGAEWERVTAAYFACLSHLHTGDWAELSRRVKRAIDKADRHDDMYAGNLFKAEPSTWCALIADRPDQALAGLDAALRGWPAQPFYLAHYRVALGRALCLVYQGDGPAAARVLDDTTPHLASAGIDHMPLFSAEYLALRSRAALLEGDLALVRKLVRRMARLDVPAAPALAALFEASLRRRDGDQHEAERLLSTTLDAFSELDAPHMEAACRYRLGQLLGGGQGSELEDSGQRWFEEQGVVQPRRLIAALTWPAESD